MRQTNSLAQSWETLEHNNRSYKTFGGNNQFLRWDETRIYIQTSSLQPTTHQKRINNKNQFRAPKESTELADHYLEGISLYLF